MQHLSPEEESKNFFIREFENDKAKRLPCGPSGDIKFYIEKNASQINFAGNNASGQNDSGINCGSCNSHSAKTEILFSRFKPKPQLKLGIIIKVILKKIFKGISPILYVVLVLLVITIISWFIRYYSQ